MAFIYKPRAAAAVKARATQKGGMYDSPWKDEFTLYKMRDGENALRILPNTDIPEGKDAADHYGIDVFLHNDIGSDGAQYICTKSQFNEPCAVCDLKHDLEKGGATKEELKDLKVSRRVACFVVDRKAPDEGVKLWPQPWTLDRDINALAIGEDGQLINLDDPEQGYDVFFQRTGTGVNTKYIGIRIARNHSAIAESDKRYWELLDYVEEHKLADTLFTYDYDYIKQALEGQAAGGERAAEPEPASGRTRSRVRDAGAAEPAGGGRQRVRDLPAEPLPEEGEGDEEGVDDTTNAHPPEARTRTRGRGDVPPSEAETETGRRRAAAEPASRTRGRSAEPENEPAPPPEARTRPARGNGAAEPTGGRRIADTPPAGRTRGAAAAEPARASSEAQAGGRLGRLRARS